MLVCGTLLGLVAIVALPVVLAVRRDPACNAHAAPAHSDPMAKKQGATATSGVRRGSSVRVFYKLNGGAQVAATCKVLSATGDTVVVKSPTGKGSDWTVAKAIVREDAPSGHFFPCWRPAVEPDAGAQESDQGDGDPGSTDPDAKSDSDPKAGGGS